jgi:hypothetical protein
VGDHEMLISQTSRFYCIYKLLKIARRENENLTKVHENHTISDL